MYTTQCSLPCAWSVVQGCGGCVHVLCARARGVCVCLCPRATWRMCAQNMVAPGDVDEDLAGETQEECSKYGPVKQVLVHEVSPGAVPFLTQ